jgi:hypothetical protein
MLSLGINVKFALMTYLYLWGKIKAISSWDFGDTTPPIPRNPTMGGPFVISLTDKN